MDRQQIAIAVDIGGTKIAGAVIDNSGTILTTVKVATPQTNSADVVAAIASVIDRLIEPACRNGSAIGIGLAVAGTVDFANGAIVQSPNVPISNTNLKSIIEGQFKMNVLLDNDGNLAALGECFFGIAKDCRDVIGLTLGTGIGSGIIIDSSLYRGATGSAAELGHMTIEATGRVCTCGLRGCFEEMASGRALVRVAKEKAYENTGSLMHKIAHDDIANITGSQITEAARQGDATALEAFEEIGFWLGIGIVNIVNIFNPEIIILGGGMSEAGELLLHPVCQAVNTYALSPNKDIVKIGLSKLGNNAGLLGASALVFTELLP